MARHFSPAPIPKNIEKWLYDALTRLQAGTEQAGAGLAAIVRGEAPDGGGGSLVDLTKFFYKPGIAGGQLAYGDTNGGGKLILSSTSSGTKGFIYLGSALSSAYDEANDRIGIGTAAPSAKLHIHIATPGTSTVGTLGTALFNASTVVGGLASDLTTWSVYQNNAGAYDLALLSGGLAAARGLYFTDFTLLNGIRIAHGIYGGGSINYGHIQAGALNSSGQSRNNNLLLLGMNDNAGTACWAQFQRFTIRTVSSTGELGSVITANNTQAAINLDADDYASSTATNTTSLLIGTRATGVKCLVLETASTSVNAFEIRGVSTGSAPSKVLGTLKAAFGPGLSALNTENALLLYASGSETVRLQAVSNSIAQWAFQDSAGLNEIEHARTTGLWGDQLAGNSNRIALGDVASSVRAVGITSAGGNILDRFGVTTRGFTIENTTLGGAAAGISAPLALLYVVNNATNGTDATKGVRIESKRTTQTGNLFEIVSALTGATDSVVNARNVLVTGRVKTAVLFTDDNATIASSKLLGLNVDAITAGQTRTLSVTDGSAYILTDKNVVIDDATGDIVTIDGQVVIDLAS